MKTILSFQFLVFCVFLPIIGNSQLVLVTGNIFNEKTGNVLENVNILEANSGIGTITNMNGFFSLMLKKGNAEIAISYDGFKNLSLKMNLQGDTTLTLSLTPVLNLKLKPKDTDHQKTAEKIDKGNH